MPISIHLLRNLVSPVSSSHLHQTHLLEPVESFEPFDGSRQTSTNDWSDPSLDLRHPLARLHRSATHRPSYFLHSLSPILLSRRGLANETLECLSQLSSSPVNELPRIDVLSVLGSSIARCNPSTLKTWDRKKVAIRIASQSTSHRTRPRNLTIP